MQALKKTEKFAELMLIAKKKRTVGPMKPIWNRNEKGQTFVSLEELQAQNREQAQQKALKIHGGDLDKRLDLGGFPENYREQWSKLWNSKMEDYFNTAQRSGGWLYLHGPMGSGKTNWASAIGTHWLNQSVINEAAFISLSDWLQGERDKFNGDHLKLPALKSVTILDDFGVFKASEWVFEQLFRLFDGLYRSKRVVIITSMFEPDKVIDRCKRTLMSSLYGGGVDITSMEAVVSRIHRKGQIIPFKG